jgi:hypothetical protein
LSHADHADLSIVDELTISVWCKFASLGATDQVICSKYEAAGGKLEWILKYDQASGKLLIYTGESGTTCYSASTVTTGTWYHVVVRVKNGTSVSLCVNGSANINSDVAGTTTPGTAQFFIGRIGGYSQYMNGLVDEVGIWTRLLTDGDVDALYASGNGLSYSSFQ